MKQTCTIYLHYTQNNKSHSYPAGTFTNEDIADAVFEDLVQKTESLANFFHFMVDSVYDDENSEISPYINELNFREILNIINSSDPLFTLHDETDCCEKAHADA